MRSHGIPQRFVSVLSAVALYLGGCTPTGLTRVPPGSDSIVSAPGAQRRLDARIGSVEVTFNGEEGNPKSEFILRLQRKLDDTDLFSQVRFGTSNSPQSITFRFKVSEERRYPVIRGLADGALTILSVGTLSLLLARVEANVEITLEAVRPDGGVKRYSSFTEGNEYFGLLAAIFDTDGSGFLHVWYTLEARTLAAALNGLMNQVAADASFYTGGQGRTTLGAASLSSAEPGGARMRDVRLTRPS